MACNSYSAKGHSGSTLCPHRRPDGEDVDHQHHNTFKTNIDHAPFLSYRHAHDQYTAHQDIFTEAAARSRLTTR